MNRLKTVFLMTAIMALFIFIGGLIGGRNGMLIAFILAFVMNAFSYWFSASMVLKMYHAVPITEAEDPKLYNMVHKLATTADLPMPQVCIINNPTPNAFATGRNPANAVVAVTTGIKSLLTDEELEGVIAHELSHVKNRDILIGSVAATVAGAIMMLANMAKFGAIFGSGSDEDNRGGLAMMLVIAVIAPLAAMVVQMAISRTREYGADAGAASITKNPKALASALNKISGGVANHPMQATPATANMFIINPLSGKGVASLFSTHPPVEERIAKLVEMDRSVHMGMGAAISSKGKNPMFR